MSDFIFPNPSGRYHAPLGDSALVGPHANRPGTPAAGALDYADQVVAILVRENGGQPPSTTAAAPARPATAPARAAAPAGDGDFSDRVCAILVEQNGGPPPRAA